MPKRIIDGEAMWASDKLASCEVWARREYAWLYPLADANGCFELSNLRVVWAKVAAIRPDLSPTRLKQVFSEYSRVGLLFTWENNGKVYGHWTKSEGRLPPRSERIRHKSLAPDLPHGELAKYLNSIEMKKVSNIVDPSLDLVLDGVMVQGERNTHAANTAAAVADEPATNLAFDGEKLKITQEQHVKLQKVYQGLNIATHYPAMDLWLDSHPEKKRVNLYAFARNWIAKEQQAVNQNRTGGRNGKKPDYTDSDRQLDEFRRGFDRVDADVGKNLP